jgi:hypothetical protein
MRDEIATGAVRLEGPSELKRAFPDWLLMSALAPFPRRRPGEEQVLTAKARSAA